MICPLKKKCKSYLVRKLSVWRLCLRSQASVPLCFIKLLIWLTRSTRCNGFLYIYSYKKIVTSYVWYNYNKLSIFLHLLITGFLYYKIRVWVSNSNLNNDALDVRHFGIYIELAIYLISRSLTLFLIANPNSIQKENNIGRRDIN